MVTPTLEDLLSSLEKKADAATPKWSARERNPESIMREFEIVQATGGILFRSTSYGNMANDAAFIGAMCPATVKKLIAALRVADEALGRFDVILRRDVSGVVYASAPDTSEARSRIREILGVKE